MKKFVLNIFFLFIMSFATTSCTYNVSMAHTEGVAEDVIDDTASNSPNISPPINLPLTPLSILQK